MRHIRTPLYRFGFLLLLVFASIPASATIAYTAPDAFDANGGPALAPPAADHQWHVPTDSGWMGTLVHSQEASRPQLVNFATEVGSMPATDSDDEEVRHRGFRTFLVIALVAGGLIRILTSPGYVRFIRDALDPKAF